jgi:cell division protein FtsB
VQQATKPKRVSALRVAMYVVLVMGMCMLMLYRYAAILESAETIEVLSQQVSDLEATNQALKAKIDRGLELGVLEAYATGQLGMIRPDSSQMFYVDMQLSDAAQRAEQEGQQKNNVLQGTPGALVNAIRVLN